MTGSLSPAPTDGRPVACAACAARAQRFRQHTAASLTALLAGLELLHEQLAGPAPDEEVLRFLVARCQSAARILAAHLASGVDGNPVLAGDPPQADSTVAGDGGQERTVRRQS
jgi:hypothetical protein